MSSVRSGRLRLLCVSCVAFLRRRIAEPKVPSTRPDYSQKSKYEKRYPPAIAHLDGNNQERRERCPDLAGRKIDSASRSSLRRREPTGDDNAGVRERARFPGAKQNPRQQKGRIAVDSAGERSEGGPPQHNPGQDTARSDAIAQRARRDLK